MENLKETQVFTPPGVTNQMLDLLDQSDFSKPETFYLEPSCGQGDMLVVIAERIFLELMKKYHNDVNKALSETLFKFYAIEIDPILVSKARMAMFEWATLKMGRELSDLENYLIAHSLQNSIECEDFFELMERNISTSNGKRAISKTLKKEKMK